MSTKGLTLGDGLVICAILLLVCAVAIPGLMSSRRASNERQASTALKTLTAAEADFRSNDRDWNHVNDFWTGDVKGLYTMTSAEVRGAGTAPKDPALRLIELETAAADADPALVPAGGENMSLRTFTTPASRKGYWFAALTRDQSLKGTSEAQYKEDTGGTPPMGKCHNTSRFGFVALPDSTSEGKFIFRVNESNTIFREALTGKPRTGTSIPPGLDAIPRAYLEWPEDSNLKTYWNND
jgi:hypothetical protein